MDFSPTEAQADLAALTGRILADQVTPTRLCELEDGPDRFDPKLWAALAEAGVLSAALPESVGGSGFGLLEQCATLVEIGRWRRCRIWRRLCWARRRGAGHREVLGRRRGAPGGAHRGARTRRSRD
jgi:hypothetical protein